MTRLFALAPLAFCLATPLAAQTLSGSEANILPRLIESACLNLVEDSNGCEQVLLLMTDPVGETDSADLVILRDRRTDPPSEPLLVARSFAFNGAMWGMSPSLEQAENGSLLVHSEQTGIGRFPWTQTLTLAYRDGAFLVAGFTYSSYDRAAGGGMTCDVNLLTGDYSVEATDVPPGTEDEIVVLSDRGRIAAHRINAADWGTNGIFPEPCNAAFAAMDGG